MSQHSVCVQHLENCNHDTDIHINSLYGITSFTATLHLATKY